MLKYIWVLCWVSVSFVAVVRGQVDNTARRLCLEEAAVLPPRVRSLPRGSRRSELSTVALLDRAGRTISWDRSAEGRFLCLRHWPETIFPFLQAFEWLCRGRTQCSQSPFVAQSAFPVCRLQLLHVFSADPQLVL